MSRITVTWTIDIPDGARIATPDVEYSDTPPEPAHVAEFPPLAEAPKYDAEERAVGNVQKDPPAPYCTLHGAMKRYPAGVSKSSGKTFNASWRCPVEKCPTRPLWDKDVA